MLQLTRLSGPTFALNPDLIERVEATPDTVVTLVNGSRYVVRESLEELIALVCDYRAELVRASAVPLGSAPAARLAANHGHPNHGHAPHGGAGSHAPLGRHHADDERGDATVVPLRVADAPEPAQTRTHGEA